MKREYVTLNQQKLFEAFSLPRKYFDTPQNGQTHFKNLAVNVARFKRV